MARVTMSTDMDGTCYVPGEVRGSLDEDACMYACRRASTPPRLSTPKGREHSACGMTSNSV